MEALRKKVGAENVATPSNTSIEVVDNSITQSQHDLENRLRVDLKTLRLVLFDSWNHGLNLDLALRIQDEIQDEVQFIDIDHQLIEQGIKSPLNHYSYFSS